ncbi:MAG: LysR family transcriptional regulator [Candidatus Leucobacter sulfamidivorax]|nr:LysR family transcriptional regulator [Candidatus Leucobacter sulfamidivorax]
MDLRQLRYFTAVCEEESFSRAAQRLHMTQPPLSTTVANLERELGIQLLHRVQHGVIPTEAGRLLALRASQILRQADELQAHLRGLGEGSEGHLTVAVAPSFAWRYIPEIIQRFTQLAPRASLTLMDPTPEVTVEEVLRGGADVGAVLTLDFPLFSEMYAGSLHMHPMGELETLAVLPSHWGQSDEPVDALDLRSLIWFLPPESPKFPGLRGMAESFWHSLGHEMPVVQEVATLQTAMPLIAGGLGVTMMPESVREHQLNRLVTRPFVQEVATSTAALIWSKEIDPSPIAQRFIGVATALTPPPR